MESKIQLISVGIYLWMNWTIILSKGLVTLAVYFIFSPKIVFAFGQTEDIDFTYFGLKDVVN